MTSFLKRLDKFTSKWYFPYFVLTLIISAIYYKLFLFGKIPFPGDLLIGSYLPWLEYHKMPIQNPTISDVFSQLILWKYLSIDAFKAFQWPLWNPYSFTGNPLLANYQSATLYPLNILLFLPKYFGWGLFIFSQTLIASLTFYLFASQITQSKLARLIGAVIFSLASLMTTWVELGTAVHGMAWLPLCLYSVKKFSDNFKFRYILLLTFSLTLIVLAGAAQITTYSYAVVIFYILYQNFQIEQVLSFGNKLSVKKTFLLFLAVFLSILITMPQLLPSYELLEKSIRQSESYSAENNHGLLPTKYLFKLFIADYFGNNITRNYWGNFNYFEASLFLGSLTLSFLIYAFFKLRSKEALFFLILFALSLVLAFDNSISQFVYSIKIPLLTSSYASRILFITVLSVSMLSALSLDHVIRTKNIAFFIKSTLWSTAAILGIIIGTLLTQSYIGNIARLEPANTILKIYQAGSEYDLNNFSIAVKNSFVPLIVLTSLLLLSTFIYKFKYITNKTNLIILVVLFLSILDLGRYFLKYNPFVLNDQVFPIVPTIEFLQKQPGLFRVGREHAEVLPPNTWVGYGLYSYEGYDPIYLKQYGKFMHFLNGGDLRTGNSSRYAEVASNYDSPFLDAANSKYFIAILRDEKGLLPGHLLNYQLKESNYKEIFRDKSTAILENPNALERVYFTKSVIVSKNPEDIIMTDKTFDPRKTVITSSDFGVTQLSGEGSIKVLNYSPNKIVLETNTTHDQVLVLSDQYEEGWRAKIDQQDTEISRANLIYRAIKIPSGTHLVTFYYLPKSFQIGVFVSVASILIIILISTFSIKRKIF